MRYLQFNKYFKANDILKIKGCNDDKITYNYPSNTKLKV